MPPNLLDQDYIQYGFAGFCFLLLCLIVWLLKQWVNMQGQLIEVINQSNKTQAKLIDSSQNVEREQHETKDMIVEVERKIDGINLKLVSRPCLKEL